MRGTFLKTKWSVFFITSIALLFSALLVIALLAQRGGYRDLLLIAPSSYFASTCNINTIEDFCKDKFLISYEIRGKGTIATGYASHAVVTIATNSIWPALNSRIMLNGSFFTKVAWDTKQRHIVLNKTAAFAIFGGDNITEKVIKMNGESWIVSGVIDDGDEENKNSYIPSSISGGAPTTLLALLDPAKGINTIYAAGALKSFGVHDTDHIVVNLDAAYKLYWERLIVALEAAFCVVFLVVFHKRFSRLGAIVKKLRDRSKWLYADRLFIEHVRDFFSIAGGALLLLAGVALCLVLLSRILADGLRWRDMPALKGALTGNSFALKLSPLRDLLLPGLWTFVAYLAALCAGLVYGVFRRRD
jgi:hypothetical protein